MRPDEVEALAKLQWSGQDALGLALQGQTENAGRRVEQDADAFRKSVLGEIRLTIFSTSALLANCSGVDGSGTIIPAMP